MGHLLAMLCKLARSAFARSRATRYSSRLFRTISRTRVAGAREILCCLTLGACSPKLSSVRGPNAIQPSRIECSEGSLPIGRSVVGSTAGGADRIHGSCVQGAGPECVHTLEVPARANVRIDLASANFDGALVLLDGSGDPRGEISCVDDTPRGDTHHTRIDATLNPGTYNVVVDGVGGESGEFELFVQIDPLPSVSAVCAAADVLTEGQTFHGSTTRAPNQFTGTCAGGARGPDHVHAFDLDVASRVRLRQQSEHDGALYVRSACEDPSSEMGCNDDFIDATRSSLALKLNAGRHYVMSDAYGREQSGDYALSFERIDEPPILSVAQVCQEAQGLAVKPGVFELDTFTAPSVLAGSCGGEGAAEIAFVVNVPERSELRAELVDAELNATLYVRERCADAATELICFRTPRIDRTPDASPPSASALLITLEPGQYTLVVDGAEPEDMGAARLLLSLKPAQGLLL